MAHYKNIKYPAFLLFSVCMSLGAFGATATLTSLEEGKEDRPPKRACVRVQIKQELLLEHLPRQIEFLKTLQEKFKVTMDSQREVNQLAAFKAACSIANLQSFSASIQDVITCLRDENPDFVSIGVGASPALKQDIDQFISDLDEAGMPSDSFKSLAEEFQKIIGDIPNPEFPADSFL